MSSILDIKVVNSYGVFCINYRKTKVLKRMKKNRLIALTCMMVILMIMACACQKKTSETESKENAKEGESWAYVHEPETEILNLGTDGKASFKGKEYKYSKDDQFITLTDEKDQSLKMRYEMKKEKLILYESTTYKDAGEEKHDGVIGFWLGGEEDRLSYEFTDKGTFMEDGYFPGHFEVNEEAGTIKLMYNDHFEDCYLYFALDGDTMTIAYPWPMTKTTPEE